VVAGLPARTPPGATAKWVRATAVGPVHAPAMARSSDPSESRSLGLRTTGKLAALTTAICLAQLLVSSWAKGLSRPNGPRFQATDVGWRRVSGDTRRGKAGGPRSCHMASRLPLLPPRPVGGSPRRGRQDSQPPLKAGLKLSNGPALRPCRRCQRPSSRRIHVTNQLRHRRGGPRPDITAEPLDLSDLGTTRAFEGDRELRNRSVRQEATIREACKRWNVLEVTAGPV
jgi:hypothetical protein